ncbi:endolytic transglycosylase MltG [Syntrophaceticus schinkii]|nr:endolytic transglycosylase MltG [Syntrophaceticus schinkii]
MSNNWSMKEIVECISSGKVAGYRLAIPEGYTVKQIEDLLVQKGIADRELFQKALGANYPLSFLEGISETGYERLEGFLFPATYELRPGMSEEEIIKLMLEKFQTVFTPQLQQRADEVDLSVREIITLASIVEREAKLEEERPQVAAVFLNRLQRGMRLESCATVQYILGKQKETLTTKDLQNPSPYNTYLHTGLPPGPIANPGASSIKAVLYPADGDYLFFVARGDGSHQFSKTFREHQEAARKYQKM